MASSAGRAFAKAAALPEGASDAVVWDHLGDVLFRLGDKAKAKAAWDTAAGLYATDARGQRDGRIEGIESGLPESRWVEQQLGRPVIKAFNNIYARHLLELGKPAGAAKRIALPVAGDDAAAKTVVLRLVDELGFDAVDAGGLDESWRQQPGTPVYTKDFDAAGVKRARASSRFARWRA